jgi:methylphosphotriester-DNA--protein-cysteine methyltransferase
MPRLSPRHYLNTETSLPEGAGRSFWLDGATWQFPNYENVDTFLNRLSRQEVLTRDEVIPEVLNGRACDISERTVRHRFLHTTGLTQKHIRQYQRAQQATALLQQGVSILDTVYEAGYFDQPHLTRSLKQFIGYTPGEIGRMAQPQ